MEKFVDGSGVARGVPEMRKPVDGDIEQRWNCPSDSLSISEGKTNDKHRLNIEVLKMGFSPAKHVSTPQGSIVNLLTTHRSMWKQYSKMLLILMANPDLLMIFLHSHRVRGNGKELSISSPRAVY